MKKGDILIAIDPCVMDDGEITLTIGKEYKVISSLVNGILIIDDSGSQHSYDYNDIPNFFITKVDDYEVLIGNIKKDIWKRILLLPSDITKNIINMQERAILDNGDAYHFYIKDNELIDDIYQNSVSLIDICIEDLIYLLEQWQELLNKN